MHSKHKTEYDVIRVIAIILVIFNHTGTDGYKYFTLFFDQKTMAATSWIYFPLLLISIFCKIAVPLFFMISGALLLGKDENYLTIFRQRVCKYILVLFFFSGFYYIINFKFKFGLGSFKDFLSTVYSNGIIIPFWFLYAYIAFLLILPLLRRLVADMNCKDYYYLFTLALVFQSFIPVAQYFICFDVVTLNKNLSPGSFIGTTVLYPVLGYGITNYPIQRKHKKTLQAAAIVLFVPVIGLTYFNMMATGRIDEASFAKFFPCCTLIQTLSVYIAICDLVWEKSIFTQSKVKNILNIMGSCVFGVYLLHPAFLNWMRIFYKTVLAVLPPFLSCWIYVFAVFFICMLLTYILKKLPGIKKLL